jgi:hypothetical protein
MFFSEGRKGPKGNNENYGNDFEVVLEINDTRTEDNILGIFLSYEILMISK